MFLSEENDKTNIVSLFRFVARFLDARHEFDSALVENRWGLKERKKKEIMVARGRERKETRVGVTEYQGALRNIISVRLFVSRTSFVAETRAIERFETSV